MNCKSDAQTKMWGSSRRLSCEWRICCWSPPATDGRPVLPLQSLGIFLSTGYASGRCWEQRMHKRAQTCKWDVNMSVNMELSSCCNGVRHCMYQPTWPHLCCFLTSTLWASGCSRHARHRGFIYRAQVCNRHVCFTHFCLVFHLFDVSVMIRCLVVTDVSCSQPQAYKSKYSWVLNVHCICITFLQWIFCAIEWKLMKVNHDLLALPDVPVRGIKKFVKFYGGL